MNEDFNPEDMPIINLDTSGCTQYKREDYEDFDLLLTGLGTFNPDDCISYEDVKHLFTTKQCTQSCTNCNLMKNDTKGEIN